MEAGRAEHADVVVIGAGMAGLAAARDLRAAGLDVLIVEARERIGGRVFTRHDTTLGVPVELGAEFVHGRAPEVEALAREAGLVTCDISGERFASAAGRLRPQPDFWAELERVMARLPRRGRDRSFQDFLAGRPGGAALAGARRLAARFVEGFHAADLTRISAHALAEGGSPREPADSRIGRVLGGYDLLARHLAGPLSGRIRLGACAERVEWGEDGVSITVRPSAGGAAHVIESRAAVITVPVGVLVAEPGAPGSIAFDPPLAARRGAIDRLAMGAVVRVAVSVREAPWSAAASRAMPGADPGRMSFVQGEDEHFPVWWTSHPLRVPLLVGWAGGPRAQRLAALSPGEIADTATRSLARLFGLSASRARALVVDTWMHDWVHDPFSRGAYSYPLVGGVGAWRALGRPLHGVLFFAGEATEPEARSGTVHGALHSGQRAARELLARREGRRLSGARRRPQRSA